MSGLQTPQGLPVDGTESVPSKPGRTKKFLSGLGLGYLRQAIIMLVGLWLTPFLLRHLGQHDYGLWAVCTQILGYLMLLDMGVFALLPRETGYATGRAQGNAEAAQLSLLTAKVLRIVLWQLPVVAIASALTWYFLPASWHALRAPLVVILATFVVLFPFEILQGVLSGMQDLSFLGYNQLFSWSITTLVSITLVLKGFGLYSLAVGWALGEMISVVGMLYRAKAKFPYVLPKKIFAATWQESRAYLGRSLWVTLSKVAQILLSGTDVLIIGKMLGPIAVVPYVCTGKLISVLSNQPQMLMDFALPGLSEMRQSESRARVQTASTALSQIMLLLSGALVCAVLLLNRSFVTWWIGANQYGGFQLTAIIMAALLLRHWNLTLVYTIFCFGYERWISIVGLADGLVTAVSAVLLVHYMGLIGAPLGGILGVCLVSLPVNLWALARETEKRIGDLVLPVAGWGLRLLLLVALVAFLQRSFVWHSFYVMVLIGVSSLLCYAALMMPVALSEPSATYVRPFLQRLRSGRKSRVA